MPEFAQTGASRQEQMAEGANAPDPLVGKTIGGRFKIVGVIARGGMGKVYKAEQAPLGRICALKVLSPKYDGDRDPEFHKRFFLEASIAAKLTHPNTVTVFDYGQSEDIYYIAMEYIEGKTLHRVLREEGPFTEARTCHIARQICRSLREAHQIGVVHRDLKPGNVLLSNHGDERDNVKVLDFGLVKDVSGGGEELTQQGLFMGSPKYMAPEQIRGADVSARTDIYSLGVMLYEMLSGKVPFDKGPGVGTLMAHVNDIPAPMQAYNPNLVVTPEMESIVFRCLEKDPQHRFGTMDELLNALKRIGSADDMLTGAYMAQSGPFPRAHSAPSLDGDSGPSAQLRRTSRYPAASDSGPSLSLVGGRPAAMSYSSPPSIITEAPAAPQSVPAPDALAGASGKRRFGLIVGVLVAGFVGIIITISLTRTPPHTTASPTAVATIAPAATPTPTPTSTPAPSTPSDRVVRIESDPSGASVVEGNETLCGGTPCDVTFRGAAAAVAHDVSLQKKGYQTKSITIGTGESKVKHSLDPLLSGKPQVVRPNGGGNGSSYKDNPY